MTKEINFLVNRSCPYATTSRPRERQIKSIASDIDRLHNKVHLSFSPILLQCQLSRIQWILLHVMIDGFVFIQSEILASKNGN